MPFRTTITSSRSSLNGGLHHDPLLAGLFGDPVDQVFLGDCRHGQVSLDGPLLVARNQHIAQTNSDLDAGKRFRRLGPGVRSDGYKPMRGWTGRTPRVDV